MRRLALALCLATPAAAAAATGAVTLDGTALPKARSTIDARVDITEFRQGGDPAIRLLPGPKRYTACIVTPAPVSALDAVLPLGAPSPRFRVGVEDGRVFSDCLLASLAGDWHGHKRRLTYCLRCENVSTP
jgi:hypothetical protein